MWHAGHKGHESTAGLVRESYLDRKQMSVKRRRSWAFSPRPGEAIGASNILWLHILASS